MNPIPHISIISPVYKAEMMIEELVFRLTQSLSVITQDFEIILVNDNLPDASWEKIKIECLKDQRIKGLNLSRNFGQHYAITAGLAYAKGEWVVVMDCDLQDRPEEIINLYNKAREGYEIVYASRKKRKDNIGKKFSSWLFYLVFSFLSGLKSNAEIANFGIYHQKVIAEYNKMKDTARSFTSLITYLGFKTATIPVIHSERAEGKSSYSLKKLFKLSLDVILCNSNRPLKLSVKFGFFISIFSLILAVYNIIARMVGIITVAGYTTTVFSIWFVGGLLMLQIGILGIYLGKVFDQVKERPLFVVCEKINIAD